VHKLAATQTQSLHWQGGRPGVHFVLCDRVTVSYTDWPWLSASEVQGVRQSLWPPRPSCWRRQGGFKEAALLGHGFSTNEGRLPLSDVGQKSIFYFA
jgi:hypothetical protein